MTDTATSPPGAIVLEIPAKAEYLSLVRAVVAAAAALDPRLGLDRIDDLRLAVSEATTNAIQAHATLGSTERITIRCDLGVDRIEVEVRDRVEGFAPPSLDDLAPLGDLEAPRRLEREGGFGLPLMRVLADQMKIRSLGDGTAVHLIVYTAPTSAHR